MQISEEISDPSDWSNVFSQEAIIALSFAMLFFVCNTLILFKSQIPHKIVNKISDIFPMLKFFGIGRITEVEVAPRINADTCCFCCGDIQREVGATCGHIFCGKCLTEFWESKNKAKLQCPLCRRVINMIIVNFARDNAAQNDEITKKVLEDVKVYNICFSNQPRTIYQVLLDFPYLMNRFVSSLLTREGFLFFLRKVLGSLYIVILIVYIISPLDLIPDYIMLIGWLDDAIVLIYLLIYITVLYYNFLQQGN